MTEKLRETIPMLAMRGIVLFPQMVLHFDVGRERSMLALQEVMSGSRKIFLVAQKDIRDEEPGADQLYKVGVVAEVKQIIKVQDHLRVLVEGINRARIIEVAETEPYFRVTVEDFPLRGTRPRDEKLSNALLRTVKDYFEEYCLMSPRMPKDLVLNAMISENPAFLAEYIAGNIAISVDEKQKILEQSNVIRRLEMLAVILEEENQVLQLEQEIQEKVKEQIDSNQREYYLREQMKAISTELGDGEAAQDEVFEYQEKIRGLHLDEDSEERLLKEADRLGKMPGNSSEAALIRTYLDTVLELPWNKETKDKIDIAKARKQLDKDHYGMEKVKERMLEMLAVRKLSPNIKGQIICLAGPPGVGKTSVARSIAKAIGRKYVRMSLGGVRDESDIRGHRKTYIGAMPGRIIAAIRQAGSNNPLLLLDEVDKLGNDFRGDPSSALLEVLDSEQNFAFRDHYIELPFDLSKVLFIATANDVSSIPQPLYDRMEIIQLSSYTREEKFQIAKRHLVAKQAKRHGLSGNTLRVTDDGIYSLIDYYTREAGVRGLEREIASLCRKGAKMLVAGESKRIVISKDNITEFLGSYKFKPDQISRTDELGLVNGLAWTSVGGEMLQVETAILDGSGKLELTGSLGDVMKESAKAAISYIRGCARQYGIDEDFYKNKDIHIHVPEGAVPKDGPSAGITICTALVSALSGIPVRGDVAMTGEITLRGRVLPIGGLKEKSMAAYRNGIRTVIIPEENKPDLDEVDEVVKDAINFVPVKQVGTVFDTALARKFEMKADLLPDPKTGKRRAGGLEFEKEDSLIAH